MINEELNVNVKVHNVKDVENIKSDLKESSKETSKLTEKFNVLSGSVNRL